MPEVFIPEFEIVNDGSWFRKAMGKHLPQITSLLKNEKEELPPLEETWVTDEDAPPAL
jgi:hypothetical protein